MSQRFWERVLSADPVSAAAVVAETDKAAVKGTWKNATPTDSKTFVLAR